MSNLKSATPNIACSKKIASNRPAGKRGGVHAANPRATPGIGLSGGHTFSEDFFLEHSTPGAGFTSIEMSGGSGGRL